MLSAHTYLHFNGNCEEAFLFYKSVFKTEFKVISRYKDAPPENAPPHQDLEKIMHISLPVSGHSDLLGSDIPDIFPRAVKGSNYYIMLNTESRLEANQIFKLLASGGVITMPLENTFWGAYFGMVIDQYGVQWMINYEHN